jgi:hypothetical protein
LRSRRIPCRPSPPISHEPWIPSASSVAALADQLAPSNIHSGFPAPYLLERIASKSIATCVISVTPHAGPGPYWMVLDAM